ncbi:murein biosynthesis integral membrane protein MurJ [Embleya sp. NBC_00896]|uniref:murein biosynthesis integral membrane protein MurJ n=1 Tax=Embleya sp. NBC_00896 TaxID=2975961 RepID=UPI0038659189
MSHVVSAPPRGRHARGEDHAAGPAARATEPTGALAPARRGTGGVGAGRGSVLRGGANLALGSVVSRLTGFARSAMVVAALGTGLFADGYNVANTVPNILYILLIGGALNSVLVPQLVRAARRDADGGAGYTDRLLTAVGCLLLALTVAGVLAAPAIVSAYADYDGAQRELTIALARMCLPQILFYGVFALVGEVLNARGRFGPMAWTPILNNVVVIAVFGSFLLVARDVRDAHGITPAQVRLLGLGTTLGIAVQACALVPYLRAAGVRWRPRFDWRGHGLGAPLRMAGWAVALVGVSQVGYWLVTRLAVEVSDRAVRSGLGHGVGYTAYANAQLLWIVPHGVVTVSIATMLMPRISRAAADGRHPVVRDLISRGLRLNALVIVPVSFFFLALAPQVTAVVFQHGITTEADTRAMGLMLTAFAPGLIAFSAQYVIQRGLYAVQDARTPFWANVAMTLVGALFALLAYGTLPTEWAVTGMAAGYSAAQVVGLLWLAAVLRRRLRGLDTKRVLRVHVGLGIVSAGAAAGSWLLARWCAHALGTGPIGAGVSLAGAVVLFGAIVAPVAYPRARRLRLPAGPPIPPPDPDAKPGVIDPEAPTGRHRRV